jgi:hypothetical protein
MPTDPDRATRRPPISSGADSAAIRRQARLTQSTRLLTSSISSTNSSPPIRATVSASRAAELRRAATSFNTASPAAWPSESLIGLKPSRSTNSTATLPALRSAICSPLRAWRCNACARRSSNNMRLGRPVSGSWNARRRNSSLAVSSFTFATFSELRMRASSVDVNRVIASSAIDDNDTTVPSCGPASASALRQTVPAGKLAAAMPV